MLSERREAVKDMFTAMVISGERAGMSFSGILAEAFRMEQELNDIADAGGYASIPQPPDDAQDSIVA